MYNSGRTSTVDLAMLTYCVNIHKDSNCAIAFIFCFSSYHWSAGDGRWRHHRRFPTADGWALLSPTPLHWWTHPSPAPSHPPLSSLFMATPFSFSLLLYYYFLFKDVYEVCFILIFFAFCCHGVAALFLLYRAIENCNSRSLFLGAGPKATG